MSAIAKKLKRRSAKWWMTVTTFVVLFGVIFTFTFVKMRMVVRGVRIVAKIATEKDSSIVKVQGLAKNAVYLTLDGREIFIDKNGWFDEPTALSPGVSVVTLSARDKFGKTSEKKFELVYKENKQVALIN